MSKYIAKPNTWFKAGTEVTLIADYRFCVQGGPTMDCGLFRGIRVCEDPGGEGMGDNLVVGEEYEDEEMCSFDEFDEVTE